MRSGKALVISAVLLDPCAPANSIGPFDVDFGLLGPGLYTVSYSSGQFSEHQAVLKFAIADSGAATAWPSVPAIEYFNADLDRYFITRTRAKWRRWTKARFAAGQEPANTSLYFQRMEYPAIVRVRCAGCTVCRKQDSTPTSIRLIPTNARSSSSGGRHRGHLKHPPYSVPNMPPVEASTSRAHPYTIAISDNLFFVFIAMVRGPIIGTPCRVRSEMG
jgi:hypothetical protein